IFSRKKNIKVDGNNVLVVPLKSPEGLFYIARCKHIFLKHTIKSNVFWELDPQKHNFYNLWHGIPLKKIHYVSNDRLHLAKRTEKENRSLSAVISASNVDRLAMTAAFWPLTFHDVWLTGLPRHDFITCAEESLPSDFYKELCNLKNVLRDRKLILFAPTFRNDQENGYYNFSKDEIDQLSALLRENNCVLGIREHMADTSGTYGSVFVGETFINLTESIFKNVEIVLRCSDVVITDYSSCFIDFLLTGRPVISFAFDRDSYLNERGMFYDLDWCFPGPVVTKFPDLIQSLDSALNGTFDRDMYNQKRSIFLEYMDSKNSNRVYN
ncbi:CDP-glycerol glycerophosphotransferase family protein, partial [Acetobacter pomorum]